ncbi:hypothetical protein MSNKSG1_17446 [Marinobacter santoriniensis NKSG1]|uniref:Ice-binding protein C-terminal domain-containing protein n=1 Tax=Marinobacter santoriniensis NKSG1 TaxID=1288826 RepID=M7D0A3_9GAMM|nr:choice-of-anchor N protein [Marinobacter santoriniensis]EMP54193.1 hypothetical protein MSNKSG1_17446 [Marinobacter santoriniensis NKSG1]
MKLRTLAALAVGILGANTALAIPTLQLDIDGGTYVGGSEESTITNDPTFDLWALGKTSGVNTAVDYYLSIALLPQTQNPGDIANFGGVTVNGTALSTLPGSPEYGKPGALKQSHGIFDTYFYELAFRFAGDPTIPSYNVQDGDAGPKKDELFKHVFQIDASALASGYGLHFDLYTYSDNGSNKTPFSHDAAYCNNRDCNPVKVSEPSTLALFGVGLMSLVAIRRRLRRA